MKNNLLTIIISFLSTCIICYMLFFVYHFFENHEHNPYLFKSIEEVNISKYYSHKLHHLRGHRRQKSKSNPEEYIFSIMNEFGENKNNILVQGDSWIEQLNESEESKSYKNFYNFVINNNLGLINSGTSSYSPSLMQLQFNILEKDFNIKPNIVIAYIDQTDIGDELCRYRHSRLYDKNNNLISVKNENHSRAVFEYTMINNISEIVLLNHSKFFRTYHLTNFFIKYGYFRGINKIKTINEYGWKNRNIKKCHFSQITKYLNKIDTKDLSYFNKRLLDYLNLLMEKDYVNKIILITFPHYNHLYEYNEKLKYNVNVSDIVEKIAQKNEKIYHLNFSKLIMNNEIKFESSAYKDDKSHIKDIYYNNIFINSIKNKILENLN